ncbi:hypothetical protein CAPTEDRAFT_206928 [Capitella teleta]|uniref:G-protein coupled receptors family 1 profile domain-containing protein n=1 Tax=Capitella teleta TaxID=283909 RepID=R7V0K3_CAPTE|nr:hypothetical protein CAPTEDRAFT_206928 [Capitella teleta]|eukprot:ELU09737.1 hypothetical protein CAPTEDRAFT_206928 [Capitella teleta]
MELSTISSWFYQHQDNSTDIGPPGYTTALNWARGAVVGLSLLLAIPANGFMVLAIVTNRQIRCSLRNVLLLHLAVCGLFLSVLVLPYNVAATVSDRVAKSPLCKAEGYITTVVTIATLWTITSICLEKYRSIARPLHHKTTVSKLKICVVFTCVWLSALVISGLPIYFGRPYSYDAVTCSCRVNYHSHDPIIRWISGVLVSSTFLAPLTILIICHIRIYFIAKSHRKSITGTLHLISPLVQAPIIAQNCRRRASQPQLPIGRRKAVRTTSYIMSAFVVLFLPISVLHLCEIIIQQAQHPVWTILAATAIQISPAVNASIYGVKNSSLRFAYSEWYRRKLANYAQRLTLPRTKKIKIDDLPFKFHYSFKVKRSTVRYTSANGSNHTRNGESNGDKSPTGLGNPKEPAHSLAVQRCKQPSNVNSIVIIKAGSHFEAQRNDGKPDTIKCCNAQFRQRIQFLGIAQYHEVNEGYGKRLGCYINCHDIRHK